MSQQRLIGAISADSLATQLPASSFVCTHMAGGVADTNLGPTTFFLQLNGLSGQRLPAAADIQTALLLGLADAAARAQLATQILAFNVSRWDAHQSDAGCACLDTSLLRLCAALEMSKAHASHHARSTLSADLVSGTAQRLPKSGAICNTGLIVACRGTVTADVWYQFEGIAVSVVPQSFWPAVSLHSVFISCSSLRSLLADMCHQS